MASCSAHERYLVDAPVQGSLGVPAPFVSAGRSRPSHLKEFFLADYLYRNALLNIFLGLADLSTLLLPGRTAADNEKIGLFCHIIGVFTAAVGDALHGFAVAQLQQLARQHAGLVEQRMCRIEQIGRRDDVLCLWARLKMMR